MSDPDETMLIRLPETATVNVAMPREYLELAEVQMRRHGLVLEAVDGEPGLRARPTHYALCAIVAEDRKGQIAMWVVFGVCVALFLAASFLHYDVMAATLAACSIFGGAHIVGEHKPIALRRRMHDKLRDAGI